jgi:hypothetical protein
MIILSHKEQRQKTALSLYTLGGQRLSGRLDNAVVFAELAQPFMRK